MKVCLALLLVLVVMTVATAVSALSAMSPRDSRVALLKKLSKSQLQDDAAHFVKLSMDDYVSTLMQSMQVADDDDGTADAHLHYYKALQASGVAMETVRDAKVGSVMDCVPFHLQPALIFASSDEVREALMQYHESKKEKKPENRSPCADGAETVAIPRPVIRGASLGAPVMLHPNPKRSHMKQPQQEEMKHQEEAVANETTAAPATQPPGPPPGYSYVDSSFANVTNGTTATYTVLGVGPGASCPLATSPMNDFMDHSINQMWWVDRSATNLVTLEAGWIMCAYWTYFPTTTLFAFSTPNGYGAGSANQYNTQGGFVMYPGAPPLANAVTEVLYMYQYAYLPNNTGFSLTLRPFRRSEQGTFYVFEDWVPLGHYPMSRYKSVPQMSVLQTGQEIDQDFNSTKLTASGKIFGWGTDTDRYPIKGNFTNFGQKMPFDYGNFPLFNHAAGSERNYTGDWYVHFHGIDFVPNGTNTTTGGL